MMTQPPDTESKSYTGRARKRTTRWTVYLTDALARTAITLGGVGTILAVCLVMVYLFSVVVPLFSHSRLESPRSTSAPRSVVSEPLHFEVDEYRTQAYWLQPDGILRVIRLDTGKTILEKRLLEEASAPITAFAPTLGATSVAIGLADGTVRLGEVGFRASFREPDELPAELAGLDVGQFGDFAGGIVERTGQGQFRVLQFTAEIGQPIEVAKSAIRALSHVPTRRGWGVATYADTEGLAYHEIAEKKGVGRGSAPSVQTVAVTAANLPSGPPQHVLLAGRGTTLYAAWEDGTVVHAEIRGSRGVQVLETVDLVPGDDTRLTGFDLLLGRTTLIVGDSQGRLSAWFPAIPAGGPADPAVENDEPGQRLALAHQLPGLNAPVTSLAMSARGRVFAAGFADGRLALFQVTAARRLLETEVEQATPVRALALSPRADGVFALAGDHLWQAKLDLRHPEATFATLFVPVWYEGYSTPAHVWQSSGGSEDLEPKLGLWPLVFGTLKATFYSMMFGAPLAVLAAIYTSEFLHPRMRARIKPTIEMMASLPSVVLGFLAANVIAIFVEDVVPSLLSALITVPLALMLGAQFWQLIPYRAAVRMQRWRFAAILLLGLPAGFGLAFLVGPRVERWLFGGDFPAWTDGQVGDARPAWLLLLLPLSALFVIWVATMWVNPWLRRRGSDWSVAAFAWADCLKFVALVLSTLLLAWAGATLLTTFGLDPRAADQGQPPRLFSFNFVDTYSQRNALIVGFVMGFAIVPIIYTITEDALMAVPEHLRAASLGAGATPVQTAIRIVIPTAMSGIFSALMIGLGRAVGETMIVLMAAGNTPLLELNMFSGLRTLSANIAVEMPEAVRGSTHFRTLFLAALTLFLITFVVNTVAELVRLRFRRRAFAL